MNQETKKIIILVAKEEKSTAEKAVFKILGNKAKEKNVFTTDKEFSADSFADFNLSENDFVIVNSDCDLKIFSEGKNFKILNCGFNEKSDFLAAEINESPEGINFKLMREGNVVPFWIKDIFKKQDIYPYLAAIAAGAITGENLVEISQILK